MVYRNKNGRFAVRPTGRQYRPGVVVSSRAGPGAVGIPPKRKAFAKEVLEDVWAPRRRGIGKKKYSSTIEGLGKSVGVQYHPKARTEYFRKQFRYDLSDPDERKKAESQPLIVSSSQATRNWFSRTFTRDKKTKQWRDRRTGKYRSQATVLKARRDRAYRDKRSACAAAWECSKKAAIRIARDCPELFNETLRQYVGLVQFPTQLKSHKKRKSHRRRKTGKQK